MRFELTHVNAAGGNARLGRIETDHGMIDTPIFMPVGTVGSVKGLSPRILKQDAQSQIILGNTYHLYLRPGTEVIEAAGGIHKFSSWDGPVLTDSGGFQVFSLSSIRKITEEGVRFHSHLDGSAHDFTPESVVDIQRSIGADIIMVLDECPPGDSTFDYAKTSNELTVRWAKRCQKRFAETSSLYDFEQALFGIVQGVVYPEIRRESTRQLVDLDFPGYAIGGLSVGESHSEMYEMVSVVNEILPADKPRYLMGVGTPENLLENISRGIDMFDCVMPTRNGRNGTLFTTQGIINIRNSKWKTDFTELDPELDNYWSSTFSKSYLRHLIQSKELLGLQIASAQNICFYMWLMDQSRQAIREDRFESWRASIQPQISQRL